MDKRNSMFIWILTIGVFGILNTEMGIVGVLPSVAEQFNVSVTQAGLLVSLFALAVAISAPIMPLLFSGINRKKAMLLVLGVFVLGNIISIFATNFNVLLIARVIPAFLHPVYVSIALTAAAASVSKEEAPKATSKIFMGVTGGLVLGAPLSSFIASTTSFEMAMIFYTVVNAIAFIAILLFVPSLPVKETLSYGSQLSVLKKSVTWLSIVTVIFINAATYGVSSYLASYLETITNIPSQTVSVMLFIFGGASILGNILAGRMLSKNALKSVVSFPFVLAAVYILLFLMGQFTVPMALILFGFGIVMAIGNNIGQYWITSAAPEAPDFANGLFLSASNLGITAGTSVGGIFISGLGTKYVVLDGFLFLILSFVFILIRKYLHNPKKQISR